MSSQADSAARTRRWSAAVQERLYARRAQLPGRKPNLRRRRGRIAVVTDSACCLPVDPATGEPQLAEAGANICCVPIPVMIGDQIYPEPSDELQRDLKLAVAQGATVRTSRPAPGRLAAAYRQLQQQGYAGIVSVHLSASLSGTVEAARLAAEQVDIPVEVVDSRHAGLALGQAVLEAAFTARLGGDLLDSAEAAETVAASATSVFAVPSLDQLRRGGRITTLASILGSLLWVKPLLSIDDGEVVLLERPRTWPRALDRLGAAARTACASTDNALIGVQSFGDHASANALADELSELSAEPVPVVELPPGLAAHLGLGAVAISVTQRPSAG